MCAFCGSTYRIRDSSLESADGSSQPNPRSRELGLAFIDAMKASDAGADGFFGVVEQLAETHLEGVSDPGALANLVGNLVYEFEAEQSVRIQDDLMAVARIVEETFASFATIASEGEATLDLPFLTADAKGPRHFKRRVTASSLAELAARRPTPPRKKGFFGRLFGS